jgi:hypothetical protein
MNCYMMLFLYNEHKLGELRMHYYVPVEIRAKSLRVLKKNRVPFSGTKKLFLPCVVGVGSAYGFRVGADEC